MATISIILPASEIPVGTTVRKPTGQKPYVLRDKIEVKRYQEGQPPLPVILEAGTLFLCTAEGIYCCSSDTLLAIDFDEYVEALAFIERVEDAERG